MHRLKGVRFSSDGRAPVRKTSQHFGRGHPVRGKPGPGRFRPAELDTQVRASSPISRPFTDRREQTPRFTGFPQTEGDVHGRGSFSIVRACCLSSTSGFRGRPLLLGVKRRRVRSSSARVNSAGPSGRPLWLNRQRAESSHFHGAPHGAEHHHDHPRQSSHGQEQYQKTSHVSPVCGFRVCLISTADFAPRPASSGW